MSVSEPPIPRNIFEQVVALRRDLHRFPELSGQESQTAQRISHELQRMGIEHRGGVGGHGVVAELPGKHDGPRIALRADMDALPVSEETGLPFASEIAGVMHACGHDGHSSMLMGAAALLLAEPADLPVRLIWQPEEETATGAQAMIRDRVLDGVAAIFGGHVDRHYGPGILAISAGPVNAATDTFRITVTGQGGHGARPHEALDAVVAGSLMVMALQTIVSREINPARPSVISVGRFIAGTAPNVIADRAVLEGTIRAQHLDTQEHLHRAIRRIATSVGQLHGAHVDVELERLTPVLDNRPEMAQLARQAAIEALGPESVTELATANMGGEDFAHFLSHVPGCYVRIGCQVPGLEGQPAHSSRFDIDERSLAAGAAWFAQVARLAARQYS